MREIAFVHVERSEREGSHSDSVHAKPSAVSAFNSSSITELLNALPPLGLSQAKKVKFITLQSGIMADRFPSIEDIDDGRVAITRAEDSLLMAFR